MVFLKREKDGEMMRVCQESASSEYTYSSFHSPGRNSLRCWPGLWKLLEWLVEMPGCWETTWNDPEEMLFNPPGGTLLFFRLFCFYSQFCFPLVLCDENGEVHCF